MIRGPLLVTAIAALLAACDGMFSLTPAEELRSFEVQTSVARATSSLRSLATGSSLNVAQDGSTYRVADGRCLLEMETSQSAPKNVKVTLNAARGSRCNDNMWALFNALKRQLEAT